MDRQTDTNTQALRKHYLSAYAGGKNRQPSSPHIKADKANDDYFAIDPAPNVVRFEQ